MSAPTRQHGFTFIEALIALSIGTMVLGQLVFACLSVASLFTTLTAESELAINMRILREKILFHAAPPVEWAGPNAPADLRSDLAGLLSGIDVQSGADSLSFVGTNAYANVGQRQTFKLNDNGIGNYLINTYSSRYNFLRPGGFDLVGDWSGIVDPVSDSMRGQYRIDFNLVMSVNGTTRRERVFAPLFLKVQ